MPLNVCIFPFLFGGSRFQQKSRMMSCIRPTNFKRHAPNMFLVLNLIEIVRL